IGEEGRFARVRIPAGEEAGDLGPVRLALLRECGGDRLRLRGEADPVALDRVAERLDREAVAREDEPALALVPQGQGPHAVEALEAIGSPGRVGVEDDLG